MCPFLLTLKCCSVPLQKRLRKRNRSPLHLPNSLTPSKPLSMTAPLFVPLFLFETLVPGQSPLLIQVVDECSLLLSLGSDLLYCWSEKSAEQLPIADGECRIWQAGLWTSWEGQGERACAMSTYMWHVCTHLLGAGGLLGNFSTLINAINFNTRGDLVQKKIPGSSLKPFPTHTSRPFTIITWRTRERSKSARSMFKTCFHCNPTCNAALSKWFRWDKAYYLQCLNIPRLLWQFWVKDHYACSQGSRSEEAIICSRAIWVLVSWIGALGLLASYPFPPVSGHALKCFSIWTTVHRSVHRADKINIHHEMDIQKDQ